MHNDWDFQSLSIYAMYIIQIFLECFLTIQTTACLYEILRAKFGANHFHKMFMVDILRHFQVQPKFNISSVFSFALKLFVGRRALIENPYALSINYSDWLFDNARRFKSFFIATLISLRSHLFWHTAWAFPFGTLANLSARCSTFQRTRDNIRFCVCHTHTHKALYAFMRGAESEKFIIRARALCSIEERAGR